MVKKWKKILLTLILILGFISIDRNQTYAANSFIDVSNSYWSKSEVDYLVSLGVISGYEKNGSDYFYPEKNLTRAQAAKMIIELLNESHPKVTKVAFVDVPVSHWASSYISKAVQLNIFDGKENGLFDPESTITRAQMSKVLAEAFHLSSPSGSSTAMFKDVRSSDWSAKYVAALYYNGVSNGSNGSFNPNHSTSRAHFSVFLARAHHPKFRVALESTSVLYKGKVTASSLNIRSGPSSSYGTIGQFTSGQIIDVYAMNGYWVKVKVNGKFGYVHKSYLKLLNHSGSVLKDRIIVVDPGHGGSDPGAVANGMEEEDINLDVSLRVREKLTAAGAKVIMTRTTDVYPTLTERVNLAKNVYAENFISIHANTASPTAKGTETYYDSSENQNSAESRKLAQAIQTRLVAAIQTQDRGIKDNKFVVIRSQNIPSVLVELGFMTNKEDAAKLASSTYREKMAQAIYQGFIDYYKQ